MGRVPQVANHLIDVVFELLNLAARLNCNRSCEVALRNRGGNVGDGTHLSGQVGGQLIDVVGQVLPGAGGTRHVRLAAQSAFHAHLPGYGGDLIGKDGEGINHVVDGVGQGRNLALGLDRQFLLDVPSGHGDHHLGDTAHLIGQVRCHDVDVVGQVLPGTGHALDLRLAAQLAVGADLFGHTGDLRREGIELIHHPVDDVLDLYDLAADVHGDLLSQVAIGNRRGHLRDVSELDSQITRHGIDVVGEVLPDAGHALDLRLAAQPAVGADFARHAGHLRCKRVELIHHGVDGVLQLQDLTSHIDGDLLGEVSGGDGGRHVSNVPHLGGQVVSHQVDAVGQVLPRAGYPRNVRLAAEFPISTDLDRDPGHFRGETTKLFHHRVDGVFELENLAADIDGDLLR